MKTAFLLLVIGALGFGGWYAYRHHTSNPASDGTNGSPLAPGIDSGLSPAATAGGSAPILQPQAVLPAEAQQAIDAGDALWNQAGANPAQSAKAPEMNRLYSKALRALYNRPGAREREEQLITERLKPLGDALFFSKAVYPDDGQFGSHTVVSGESPEAIAKRYGISRELLNRFRGRDVNDAKLRIGDTFKIIRLAGQTDPEKRGYFIHIDKGDFYLDNYVGGLFARRYVCSLGATTSPTPIGHTHVTNRVWHPDWTHPVTHQVIPFGQPDHLLGPIWLACDAKELGRSGIGIHGYTGADAKWGVQVSNGCVRLQNAQAEELYQTLCHPDRTPIGVEITE